MTKSTLSKKSVKKTFYEVIAPITSTPIHVYSSGPEEIEGRVVKLDLTKTLRGKSFELKLRIKSSDNKLQAFPESIELLNSYIQKVMRNGIDYGEDSFDTECKDSLIRIKPFFITRKRVSRTILKVLRKTAREYLVSYIKTRPAQELFADIISNKIQKQLAVKLKKIYPLALCEIRVFEIISEKENTEKKVAEENKKA
ncbi:MAG: hypothetical protein AABX73_03780 [Nanoarchaeota archaeon]